MKLNIILLILPIVASSQVNIPSAPPANQVQRYDNQNFNSPITEVSNLNITFDIDKQRQERQVQSLMNEVDQHQKLQEKTMSEAKSDIEKVRSTIQYNLPSFSNVSGTEYYRNVFDKMLTLDEENYSIKDVNFEIENAYLENKFDKDEFDKIIKQSGEFLIAKMKELNYDTNSNTAKNFMLFQYFSETLKLKGTNLKHEPLKYDFEDYRGAKNWSKMFVTKLLKTGKGQCHSMPLLYLTIAEEIGAEAFLAVSPEHSYIKFQDETNDKWYNLELTNGMFTTTSFILNSGYIKAEAMQNQIYMKNHTKKELLSMFYSDLASGYIHKFGYDEFVQKVISKSLDLYPKNISAQMIKSNYDTAVFEYAMKKLDINPRNKQDLQRIRQYPEAILLLKEVKNQYQSIDDLGYEPMPADAYEKWLGSLKEAKNKQDDETFKKQFKGVIINKIKG